MTAHLYWGGGRLSYLQHLTIISFKKHNPDWDIILWMPKTISFFKPTWDTNEQVAEYTGKDYLAAIKELCTVKLIDFDKYGAQHLHEVQKSDFIRWHILYRYGGVWSDMDILYIKPIPKWNFDTSLVYDGYHHLIGFYITKSHQRIFKELFAEAKNRVLNPFDNGYQFFGSRMVNSVLHGNETSKYATNIVTLPMQVVYPYTSDQVDEIFLSDIDRVTDETIGIHWYNGHSTAREYQNGLIENSYIINKYVLDYSSAR